MHLWLNWREAASAENSETLAKKLTVTQGITVSRRAIVEGRSGGYPKASALGAGEYGFESRQVRHPRSPKGPAGRSDRCRVPAPSPAWRQRRRAPTGSVPLTLWARSTVCKDAGTPTLTAAGDGHIRQRDDVSSMVLGAIAGDYPKLAVKV